MNLKEIGSLALGRGDYQEAVNIFRRSLESVRDAGGFVGLATAYEKLGDARTARWALAKALEIDPSDAAANAAWGREASREPIPSPGRHAAVFRAGNGAFELLTGGAWSPLFIKGINVGLGLPGHFPREYPIGTETYRTWLRQIGALGINAVRVSTIHPPGFYQALRAHNESEGRLFLFQGISVEPPEGNDFSSGPFNDGLLLEIRQALDVVYGNARLPERPGHPSGEYRFDVSPYTAGYLFGRGWESCAVRAFNARSDPGESSYRGEYIEMDAGTPFEVWIAGVCDRLQSLEFEGYRLTHPVSAVNWPTLDPLVHPSESTYEDTLRVQGGRPLVDLCSENEDVESLDVARMRARSGAGLFATYHAYPHYPDFLNYDYAEEENPYRAYLRALRQHHADQPVLIGEFGVPSSRDVSHWHVRGWHHGGHSEIRQGEINGLLMESVHEAGMAGGLLFAWFDE